MSSHAGGALSLELNPGVCLLVYEPDMSQGVLYSQNPNTPWAVGALE